MPLIFITCCNHFTKFLMRFSQVFSGIFFHSLIVNSWRFFGDQWFIKNFNSCHRFSIWFQSGFFKSHGRTVIFFFWSLSVTDLDICLGSLSSWKVNRWPRSKFCTNSCRFSSRIFRFHYSSYFLLLQLIVWSPLR